jgi:hypothetical protein
LLAISSILIISLLCDNEIKDVKIHTFKLKHEYNEEEDLMLKNHSVVTIEMKCNTALSPQTMSTRMAFTGPLMFSYVSKCLTDNDLEDWQSVTLHQHNQTIENFYYSQEEWLTSLLPDNVFVSQKDWKTNVIHKPYTMKEKDFGKYPVTLNQFLALMPHNKQDSGHSY